MVASHSYKVENETETKTKKKKRKRIKKGFKNDEQNSDCHFEIPPETGSVLCRIALWDGFNDAVPFCIGFHEVAQKNGSNFVFQNSPIMQFERSPKLANIHVDNLRVLFKKKKLHCVPVSLASLRVTEATSRGHIACNIAG